jgi:hypothetical protein
MKISVDEIPQSPKEIKFSESVEELNEIYRRSNNRDFGFPSSLEVDLTYYRSGPDIFFSGRFQGMFRGCCARCLENYSFSLNRHFDFVLTPDPAKAERRAEELRRDELGLSYYSSDEINLEPLIAGCAPIAARISMERLAPVSPLMAILEWRSSVRSKSVANSRSKLKYCRRGARRKTGLNRCRYRKEELRSG